jgi:hypothetical protein
MNRRLAVPALVNWALPSRWVGSQYAAVASQKFTCPARAVDPPLTAAVSITGDPDATEVTGLPADDICRVVEVEAAVPIVTAKDVVAVWDPEVPVMVTVFVPSGAELLAVRVSTLLPVAVGFGEKVAVTPLGRPAAARLTLPANPY